MELRGFLALLRFFPELVEADLSRFHHIDIRDRFRRHPDGMRRLTLRMMYVRVRKLPAKSALSLHFSGGDSAWDLHAYILADIAKAIGGINYESRPQAKPTPEDRGDEKQQRRARRREAARKRARAHNAKRTAAKRSPATTVNEAIAQAKANAVAIEKGGGNV